MAGLSPIDSHFGGHYRVRTVILREQEGLVARRNPSAGCTVAREDRFVCHRWGLPSLRDSAHSSGTDLSGPIT